MRHDKLERELNMLLLLTGNRGQTVESICRHLGISRRNCYYYLEFFRDCGFVVEKRGCCYSIGRNSPFFKKLTERVTFTEDEAIVMRRLLDRVDEHNALIQNLKEKLDGFYDFNILNDDTLREQRAHNISMLYDAIKYKQLAVLKGYSSPHSNTTKDRVVEPFMLMNNNNEVRCYELSSGMNKTFKVARMEDVLVLDLRWEHESRHRRMHTDIFMFSGETLMPARMLLGTLAYNVMKEEYPQAREHIVPAGDGRWMLDISVCSYAGIGRFVLGLYEDIQVLGGEGFVGYLNDKIMAMKASVAARGDGAEKAAGDGGPENVL